MASRIHSLIPKLAIALGLLALGVVPYGIYRWVGRTYDVPNDSDIFQALQGTWTLSGPAGNCDTSSVTIGFTPDRADMILVSHYRVRGGEAGADSLARYPLLGHTPHSIRIVRPGETDLAADGTPVMWELVLRSPNTYAWHRADWPPIRFTHDLRRCPADQVSQ
jgi:hypothetical protein